MCVTVKCNMCTDRGPPVICPILGRVGNVQIAAERVPDRETYFLFLNCVSNVDSLTSIYKVKIATESGFILLNLKNEN